MTRPSPRFAPDYRVHPGECVAEYLELLGIDAAEFARRSGLDPSAVAALVDGRGRVSEEAARGLGSALGVEPSLWTGLQRLWDGHPLTLAEVRKRG